MTAEQLSDEDTFDTVQWHRDLITKERYNPDGSSVKEDRDVDQQATSDRARVIYSSAFRRLQHKTQVFTLAKDAAVRTRLTHSLEVASTGRWIAQKVVDQHLRGKLEDKYCSALVSLVETGCLAHDIGNPPFGHFGEKAIQKWFKDRWVKVAGQLSNDSRLHQLVEDFLQFDGNPQGIRILTRLQGRTREEREKFGMDLTYSQVLTALKYPRGPLDSENRKTWKKAGFFESERDKIDKAWEKLGFKLQRFPLAYLVEAADDISYCISDMEDGIDQGMFEPLRFFDLIVKEWIPKSDLGDLRKHAEDYRNQISKEPSSSNAKDLFFKFKTEFGGEMIKKAASLYGDGRSKDIRDGKRPDLFHCEEGQDANDLLELLKEIARTFLYPADKVQRPFLAGRKIVYGILEEYSQLLELTQSQFGLLRKAYKSADRKKVSELKLETLLPLLDLLPLHYLEVYDCAVDPLRKNEWAEKLRETWGPDNWEWFCRAHLIVDYLSGMTDDFAHRTYQIISGASLE